MRTAVVTAPRTVELQERELPDVGPGGVRLRVAECGVCTSELDLWAGAEPGALPALIGHELAGVVEDVGAGVADVRAGDRVAAWVPVGGGFAEHAVVEAEHCVRVSPSAAFPAVAEPLSCCVNAVELAAPALGADVVIVGAGFMANLIQLLSPLKGARSITVADVREDARARARVLGATRVVDPARESLAAVVGELTDGRGADVTYEVTGVAAGLTSAGEVTRMGGTLCIVGYHQGPPRPIRLGHWNWMAFDIRNAHFRDIATIMRGMRAGMRLVVGGLVDASPLVTHRYPLDRIAEAFLTAAEKPPGFVKAVIEP